MYLMHNSINDTGSIEGVWLIPISYIKGLGKLNVTHITEAMTSEFFPFTVLSFNMTSKFY